MKKSILLFTLLLLVSSTLLGCQTKEEATTTSSQIANPIVEYQSITEMNDALPFAMLELIEPDPYHAANFSVISKEMGQITYQDGEAQMILRMTTGSGDISGVNGAQWKETVRISDIDVELWEYDVYRYALWTYKTEQGQMAYSLMADTQLTQKALTGYVRDLTTQIIAATKTIK